MPFAQINNQGIFYQDSGGSDKPTLIFLHGFLFNQAMFDPQVESLKSDYRCIRFDARAMGQTEWDGKEFNLYDTVADCIGLMDNLKIKTATLVGMSQGGYGAFRVALKHPSRVDGLILMSTTHNIDNDEFKRSYRSVRDAWKESDDAPDVIINNMLNLFLGDKDKYADLWDTWKPQFEKIKGNQVFHGMNNLLERDQITEDMMAKLTMPSLVIHGDKDIGMPFALGEKIYEGLPNAKNLIKVEGAAHAANLQEPEIVNEAIRSFLSEHIYN